MNRAGVDTRDPNRFLATLRNQDRIPQAFEQLLGHYAQPCVVFRHQDGFHAPLENPILGALRGFG